MKNNSTIIEALISNENIHEEIHYLSLLEETLTEWQNLNDMEDFQDI